MKHPFRDRIVIIFTSVILLALALGLLGLVSGYFVNSMGLYNLPALHETSLPIKLGVGAAIVVLVVLALVNFCIIIPPKKRKDLTYTIQQAENGELKISLTAISHLVEKCIAQHPELSGVESKIISNEESVTVELHLTLSTDINIPMAVTALQKEIKQYVEATSGVHVEEVRVVVDSTETLPAGAAGSPYLIPEMVSPIALPQEQETRALPEDDAHMYTFQEEPAHASFTPPAPPVNAYGDDAGEAKTEDGPGEAEPDEMPEDNASDAHRAAQQPKQDPETDVWMMGSQSPLPNETEEEET